MKGKLLMLELSYVLQFWWMFPIAILICITVNIIGISGSVLFIPFYTFLFPFLAFHLTPIQIIQLGLFTETCGFASSTFAFWRQKLIDGQIARFALLFAIPMAIVGSILANRLPGGVLLLIVGLALLPLAYLILRESRLVNRKVVQTLPLKGKDLKTHVDARGRNYQYTVKTDGLSMLCGLLGGLLQGLVGFSAGEMNSTLQILRKTPVRIATGTAHLIIFGASFVASCTHIIVLHSGTASLPWNILFMTIPAVLIGGQLACIIAGRLPQHLIQMIMGRFLVLVGFLTIYRAFVALHVALPTWWLLVACLLFIASVVIACLQNWRLPDAQVLTVQK